MVDAWLSYSQMFSFLFLGEEDGFHVFRDRANFLLGKITDVYENYLDILSGLIEFLDPDDALLTVKGTLYETFSKGPKIKYEDFNRNDGLYPTVTISTNYTSQDKKFNVTVNSGVPNTNIESIDAAYETLNSELDKFEAMIDSAAYFVDRMADCILDPYVSHINRKCLHTSQLKDFIKAKNKVLNDDEEMICVTARYSLFRITTFK